MATNPFRGKNKHEAEEPQVEVAAVQYSGTPAAEPVKQQVEVAQPSGDVTVVNTKPGEVGFVDKLKAYYHTIITVIGALLLLINEFTPLTDSLGSDVQKYINIAVVFLTALLNFLKSNEVWVNKPNASG